MPDEHHTPEHGVEPDDLNVGAIVTIALLSTVLLVACVLGVTALVDRFEVTQDRVKIAEKAPKGLFFNGEMVFKTPDDALTDQLLELNGYRANDDGTFAIDIEQAKGLVVADYRNDVGDRGGAGEAATPLADTPPAESARDVGADAG